MKSKKTKGSLRLLAVLLLAFSLVISALAAGGPNSGSGTASVSGSYDFGYSYTSTYYGSLYSERPNVSTESAAANASFSSNVFTFTATSAAGKNPIFSSNDRSAQNVSTEVTITNKSGKTLSVGYTYSVSGGTDNNSDLTVGSGTLTWLPDASYNFSVKTTVTNWAAASSTATATLTITSCTEVSNYDLSVYPSRFGTYSYTIGDATATLTSDSAAFSGTASSSDTLSLTVPTIADAYKSDYSFYGWSVNGKFVASSSGYSAPVTTHTTVFPVILKNGTIDDSGNGPFYVNGSYYVFWKEAFEAAGTDYPVIIARNFTLPTTLQENGVAVADGKYIGGTETNAELIVPANATLLIPHDSAGTTYYGTPTFVDVVWTVAPSVPYVSPSDYRVLTLADGASMTVNGNLCVSGQPVGYGAGGEGCPPNGGPSGPTGRLQMNGNSTVMINGGLYTYGYITGDGSITVNSGAEVYELFTLMDYRGGGNTSTLKVNTGKKVFPFSQYYMQNIEVALTVKAGASAYAWTGFGIGEAGSSEVLSSKVHIVGNSDSAMFKLTSGQFAKKYIPSNDRLQIDIDGVAAINSITVKFNYIFDQEISSADYYLPIQSNWTVNINSGTVTANQALALLPGAELNVASGAKAVLAADAVIYDMDQWGDYCDRWGHLRPINYRPGGLQCSRATIRSGTLRDFTNPQDARINVDGTLTATSGKLYTTSSGAEITSSEGTGQVVLTAGSVTTAYQATQTPEFVEIPITTAKLLNADGSFTETTGASNTTYNYCATHGLWYTGECRKCNCTHANTELINKVDATCTSSGYSGDTVCSDCGETVATGSETAKSAHTPGAEATCTTAQTCAVCGATIKAALGHTEVVDAAVDATCTATGLTEGKHCETCGEVLVAQEEVAALGHTEVTDAAVAATCTEAGLTEGKHCSVCSEVIVAQTVVAAKGHTEVVDAAVDATCTETGLTEGKHCSVCGTVTVAQEEVAALGHTEVTDAAVAATCTATGLTEGKHCSICNEVITAQKEVPATGHTDTQTSSDQTGFLECDGCDIPLVRLAAIEASADAATELRLKFYIHDDLLKDTEGNAVPFCAKISFRSSEKIVELSDMTYDSNRKYYVLTQAVASGEMADDMTVRFFAGSSDTGEQLTIIEADGQGVFEVSRSVMDYAELVLKKSSNETQKELVKALVTYGGYAQEFFSKTDSSVTKDPLAYSILGESAPKLEASWENQASMKEYGNVKFTTWQAFLDSAIYLRLKFTADSLDGYTFKLTYPYKSGQQVILQEKEITPTADSSTGSYWLDIAYIPAAFFDYPYTITISNSGGSQSVTVRVTDYLYGFLSAGDATAANLAKAMYLYGKAAEAFFFPSGLQQTEATQ